MSEYSISDENATSQLYLILTCSVMRALGYTLRVPIMPNAFTSPGRAYYWTHLDQTEGRVSVYILFIYLFVFCVCVFHLEISNFCHLFGKLLVWNYCFGFIILNPFFLKQGPNRVASLKSGFSSVFQSCSFGYRLFNHSSSVLVSTFFFLKSIYSY